MTHQVWDIEYLPNPQGLPEASAPTLPYSAFMCDGVSGGGMMNARLLLDDETSCEAQGIRLRQAFKISACPLKIIVTAQPDGTYQGMWGTGHDNGWLRMVPRPRHEQGAQACKAGLERAAA